MEKEEINVGRGYIFYQPTTDLIELNKCDKSTLQTLYVVTHPAGAALALVLDGSDGALGHPVDAVGQISARVPRPDRPGTGGQEVT